MCTSKNSNLGQANTYVTKQQKDMPSVLSRIAQYFHCMIVYTIGHTTGVSRKSHTVHFPTLYIVISVVFFYCL